MTRVAFPSVLLALMLTALPTAPAAARGIPQRAGGPDVHTILDVGHPLEPGDYVWDDDGAPAGATHIVVDTARRQLYVYRGGVEIGRSFAVAGPPESPTPLGRFPILEKDADKYSRSYDAPMPYALRLTRSYVAIHGSKVEWDWVTHGCIGVPLPFARILFRNVRVGDDVLVTRNWLPAAYD
jgi:lipoprotein-anchoring transpeptidase ErfK/SrfK